MCFHGAWNASRLTTNAHDHFSAGFYVEPLCRFLFINQHTQTAGRFEETKLCQMCQKRTIAPLSIPLLLFLNSVLSAFTFLSNFCVLHHAPKPSFHLCLTVSLPVHPFTLHRRRFPTPISFSACHLLEMTNNCSTLKPQLVTLDTLHLAFRWRPFRDSMASSL